MRVSNIIISIAVICLVIGCLGCSNSIPGNVDVRLPVFDTDRFNNPISSEVTSRSVTAEIGTDGYTLISTDGDFFNAMAEVGMFSPVFKGMSDIQNIPAEESSFEMLVDGQSVPFSSTPLETGFLFSGLKKGVIFEVVTNEGSGTVASISEDYIFDFYYNDNDVADPDGLDDPEEIWTIYKYYDTTANLTMEVFHAKFDTRYYQYIVESENGNGNPGDGHAGLSTTELFKTAAKLGVLSYDWMTEDYSTVTPYTLNPKDETITSMRDFLSSIAGTEFDTPLISSVYIQFVVYDLADGSTKSIATYTDYADAEAAVRAEFDIDGLSWTVY